MKIREYFFVKSLCLAFFLLPFLISAESTQSPATVIEKNSPSKELENRLTPFFCFVQDQQEQGLMDGEILITLNGKILLNLQNPALPAEGSFKSQFLIGSVSKQFFAVALLKSLYETSPYNSEAQKIADVQHKLHSPISDFLPNTSTIWDGNMPAWANEVSLHHLLTHTSGIRNYTDMDECGYVNLMDSEIHWFERSHTPQDVIKLISKQPLQFPPGSEYSYCNTGYVLIAEILESVSALPASIYMQEQLFMPLGLSSTASPEKGIWSDLKLDPKLSRLAEPLRFDPRSSQLNLYPQLHNEDISAAKGAGSIISTSTDLLKWNIALHKDKSVLPPELYNLFITADKEDYGYGIGIENTDLGILLGHRGSIGAYQSLLLYLPEQDLSIIMLSNVAYDYPMIEAEFREISESLRETYPADDARYHEALKRILDKYPCKRGFDVTLHQLNKCLLSLKDN